jgi:hypothetical protein
MSRQLLQLFAAALVLSTLAAPAVARGRRDGPTAPGKYTDWAGEIDELEIVQAFKLSDYSKVIVEPFDTKDTPLPDKDDNTYEPVTRVLVDPAKPFTDDLSEELGGRVPVSQGSGGDGQLLLIRVKVSMMAPGSKAARYWGGFGAGAARTELQGEVVDASTGKTLLRFKQERRSGVGALGGDYVSLMNRNLRTIGKDVAGVLRVF